MKSATRFFLLAYFICWVIWLPLYLPAFGIITIPKLPFNHGLGAWGPLLAGVFLTWRAQGKPGTFTKTLFKPPAFSVFTNSAFQPVCFVSAGGLTLFRNSGAAGKFILHRANQRISATKPTKLFYS